ncbi:MAG: cell division protein FtsQ, partial [Gammaproteobacteria bacterium]|nr:cell division protein FtsQ [Gammaproteobacteria bacterium]
AFARWNSTSLVNTEGAVFTPDIKTIPEGLPQLSGPDGMQIKVVARYIEAAELLSSKGLHLRRLSLNARHAWTAELDNGMTLLLGSKNSQQRLARFLQIYETVFAGAMDKIKRVDLRYSNGFSVNGKQKLSKAVVLSGQFRG